MKVFNLVVIEHPDSTEPEQLFNIHFVNGEEADEYLTELISRWISAPGTKNYNEVENELNVLFTELEISGDNLLDSQDTGNMVQKEALADKLAPETDIDDYDNGDEKEDDEEVKVPMEKVEGIDEPTFDNERRYEVYIEVIEAPAVLQTEVIDYVINGKYLHLPKTHVHEEK